MIISLWNIWGNTCADSMITEIAEIVLVHVLAALMDRPTPLASLRANKVALPLFYGLDTLWLCSSSTGLVTKFVRISAKWKCRAPFKVINNFKTKMVLSELSTKCKALLSMRPQVTAQIVCLLWTLAWVYILQLPHQVLGWISHLVGS